MPLAKIACTVPRRRQSLRPVDELRRNVHPFFPLRVRAVPDAMCRRIGCRHQRRAGGGAHPVGSVATREPHSFGRQAIKVRLQALALRSHHAGAHMVRHENDNVGTPEPIRLTSALARVRTRHHKGRRRAGHHKHASPKSPRTTARRLSRAARLCHLHRYLL